MIYHIHVATPFGDHWYKIAAATGHKAAECALETTLSREPNLTREHLTLHHMGSEES